MAVEYEVTIIFDKDHRLPRWFTDDMTYNRKVVTLRCDMRVGYDDDPYDVYGIYSMGDINGKRIGMDKNYHFFLETIELKETPRELNDTGPYEGFAIFMFTHTKKASAMNKKLKDLPPKLEFTFEILPPIVQ